MTTAEKNFWRILGAAALLTGGYFTYRGIRKSDLVKKAVKLSGKPKEVFKEMKSKDIKDFIDKLEKQTAGNIGGYTPEQLEELSNLILQQQQTQYDNSDGINHADFADGLEKSMSGLNWGNEETLDMMKQMLNMSNQDISGIWEAFGDREFDTWTIGMSTYKSTGNLREWINGESSLKGAYTTSRLFRKFDQLNLT